MIAPAMFMPPMESPKAGAGGGGTLSYCLTPTAMPVRSQYDNWS